MYVCSTCLEKTSIWTNMSTKYQYCNDCVPRGCNCNNESIFNSTTITLEFFFMNFRN